MGPCPGLKKITTTTIIIIIIMIIILIYQALLYGRNFRGASCMAGS